MKLSPRQKDWVTVLALVVVIGMLFSMYGLAEPGIAVSPGEEIESELPVVGSWDNFRQLLEEASRQNESRYFRLKMPLLLGGTTQPQAVFENSTASSKDTGAGADDFSTTNLQVAGVDEADLVKTDGEYIYLVNRQQVVIARAVPPENMEVASRISFDGESFTPQELYLDERYLVVIGSNYQPVRVMESKEPGYCPPGCPGQTAKAVVFDHTDKTNLKKLREIELDGYYLSSRKIGSALYLVAQKPIPVYPLPAEETSGLTPAYRDTAASSEFTSIDYADIRYFPRFLEPNFVVIAGVNLDSPHPAQVSSYLGAGENIYASLENLYLAVTCYQQREPLIPLPEPAEKVLPPLYPPYDKNTRVYRFTLDNGKATCTGSGEVPGKILNQFSMDEFDGCFRIATTQGEPWWKGEAVSKNHLYVLDDKLCIIGRLEDIAPGEKIYSVRFMGERCYLVTFEKVDPFFVIDLKDPQNPKMLGALKIPGYSDYLHPYDENHIIGFGKDTVELPVKDRQGNVVQTQAYYLGMRLAIFDVSDVSSPKEIFCQKIGDRGTESELLRNHRALLFSREKKLLAFPITVMEVKDRPNIRPDGTYPEHGSFSFQGAYVYQVDLDDGFTYRGRITHLTPEDYLKAGSYYHDSEKFVKRIIYISDTLYTLSPSQIRAHGMSDLEERGTLFLN